MAGLFNNDASVVKGTAKKRSKRYPTDLTDAEWEIVRPFLPAPPKRGRKPTTDLREVLNALRYLVRSGGGWRMLPRISPDLLGTS